MRALSRRYDDISLVASIEGSYWIKSSRYIDRI